MARDENESGNLSSALVMEEDDEDEVSFEENDEEYEYSNNLDFPDEGPNYASTYAAAAAAAAAGYPPYAVGPSYPMATTTVGTTTTTPMVGFSPSMGPIPVPPLFPGSTMPAAAAAPYNPYHLLAGTPHGCPPMMMDPIQAQLAQARMLAHYATQLANNIQQQIDLSSSQPMVMPMQYHHLPNNPMVMGGSISSTTPQYMIPQQTRVQRYHVSLEEEMQRQHQSFAYSGSSCCGESSASTSAADPHTASRQRSRDRQRSQHDEGTTQQPNKRRQKIRQHQPLLLLQPTSTTVVPTPLFSIMESSSTLMDPSSTSAPAALVQGPYNNRQSNYFHSHRPGDQQQQPLLYHNTPNSSNKRRISHSYNTHSASVNSSHHHHHHHHHQQGDALVGPQSHRKRTGKKHDLYPTSPRPLNLIGKTGVMALHELCSKFHWDPPRFVEVTGTPPTSTSICEPKADHKDNPSNTSNPKQQQHKSKRKLTTSSSVTSLSSSDTTITTAPLHCHEFLINAFINGTLYGTGRGGTKAAARQDAARKALTELLPGISFDINGIVLKMPIDYEWSWVGFSSKTAGTFQPSDFSRLAIDQQREEQRQRSVPGSLVAAAARIASPSTSEESSSILFNGRTNSTAASNSNGGTAGPAKLQRAVLLNNSDAKINHNNLNPCCPSSGISSASEDDENSYYASRGASVCSSLLHAMWQIDERIREPPRYSFEVFFPSSKLGGSKDTFMEGRCASLHRSSFSCTASLVLHEDKKRKSASVEGEKLEHLNSSRGLSVDTRSNESEDGVSELKDSDIVCSKVSWLEAVGTGATKREARHAASAKLLMLLFPTCSSLVEVIAAAEAAREAYAASKVQLKQHRTSWSSTSCGGDQLKHCQRDFISKNESPKSPKECHDVSLKEQSSTSEDALGSQLCDNSSGEDPNRNDFSPWSESLNVENLSISESKVNSLTEFDKKVNDECLGEHENRLIQFSCHSKALAQLHQFHEDVDEALQKLQHSVDESGGFEKSCGDNDYIGSIVLRRALLEDAPVVAELFHTNFLRDHGTKSHSESLKWTESMLAPLPQVSSFSEEGEHPEDLCTELNTALSCKRLPVILLLCKSALEEMPWACVVLTPSICIKKGKVLQVTAVAHKEHLCPRERLLAQIEAFASQMNYELEPGEQFLQQQQYSENLE